MIVKLHIYILAFNILQSNQFAGSTLNMITDAATLSFVHSMGRSRVSKELSLTICKAGCNGNRQFKE